MSSSKYSNVIKVFLYLANIFDFDKDDPRSTFNRIFHPENLFTCLKNIELRVNFLNVDGYFVYSMNNLYLKMDHDKQQISKCNKQKIEDFKININNLNKTLQAYYNSVADIVLTSSPYIKQGNKIIRMELGGRPYEQILQNSIDVMMEKNDEYMKEDPDADPSSEEEDTDPPSEVEQEDYVSGPASSGEWTAEEAATKHKLDDHMKTLTAITDLREQTRKAKDVTAKQAAAEAAARAVARAAAETAQSESSLPVSVVNENSRTAAAAAVEAAEAAVNADAEAAVNAEAGADEAAANEAQAAATRGRGTTAMEAAGSAPSTAAARAARRLSRNLRSLKQLNISGGRKKKRPTKKKPTKKRPTKRRKSTIKRTNTKKRRTKRRR